MNYRSTTFMRGRLGSGRLGTADYGPGILWAGNFMRREFYAPGLLAAETFMRQR